ncbi:MAG: biopolymer transporter ExbD [Burkholderiales bacterium PBB1]|nr:MAG: biopolymer transporter ExbD [Burkholderiales bacterium PBB1]
MAMNIGSARSDEPEVMMDINTTPLIDVMLVLIIMLIITIPVQLHAVNLNMPQASEAPPVKPAVVTLVIEADGTLRWNGEVLADRAALETRLKTAAAQAQQPELHLRANKAVDYGVVAMVLASAQRLGMTQLGLVGNEQFAP